MPQQPKAPRESAENVVSGLFKKIFGGGKKQPKHTQPANPPRAIVVEEPVQNKQLPPNNSPPPRAIVVQEAPRPQKVTPKPKPIVVRPVTAPPRAVVVPEPRPQASPKAIVVEEPAPPRAIIVD